jgi:hypothetical protein
MNPDAALVLREDLGPVTAPVPKEKGVAGEWFEREAYGVTPMLKRASVLAVPDSLRTPQRESLQERWPPIWLDTTRVAQGYVMGEPSIIEAGVVCANGQITRTFICG